jgi:transcription initiation factor TFIID subunit 11
VKSEADGGSVTGSFTGSLTGSADGGVKGRRKKGRKDREGTGSGRATVVDGGGSAEGGSIKAGTGEGSMAEGQDEVGVEEDEDDVDDADLLGGDEGTQTDAEAERKNLAYVYNPFRFMFYLLLEKMWHRN